MAMPLRCNAKTSFLAASPLATPASHQQQATPRRWASAPSRARLTAAASSSRTPGASSDEAPGRSLAISRRTGFGLLFSLVSAPALSVGRPAVAAPSKPMFLEEETATASSQAADAAFGKAADAEGLDPSEVGSSDTAIYAGAGAAVVSLGAALYSGSQTANELELSREEAAGLGKKLEEAKGALKAEQTSLEDTRAELDSTTAQLKQLNSKLSATLAEKSAGDTQAAQAISSGKKQIESLMEEIKVKTAALDQKSTSCLSLEEEVRSLTDAKAQVETELASKVQELDESLKKERLLRGQAQAKEMEVGRDLKSTSQNLDDTKAKLEQTGVTLELVEAKFESSESKLQQTKSHLAIALQELEQKEAENKKLLEAGDAARTDASQKQTKITGLEKDITTGEAAQAELQKKLEAEAAQVKKFKGELSTAQDQGAALRKELEQLKNEFKIRQEALDGMTEKCSALSVEAQGLREQSKEYSDEWKTSRKWATELADSLDATQKELEVERNRVQGFRVALGSAEATVEVKESALQHEVETVRQLRAYIAQTKFDMEDQNQKLAASEATLREQLKDAMGSTSEMKKAMANKDMDVRELREKLAKEQQRAAELEAQAGEASQARHALLQLQQAGEAQDKKLVVELAGAKEELNTVKKASRAEIATLAAELSELKQKMAAMKMASGSPN